MDRLIEEVRAALRANMFTLGLQGALALIDICAATASEDGRTRGPRFRAWFKENLSDAYRNLNAEDVYQLRCGMLHQGRTASEQYNVLLFTLPHESGNVLHNDIADNGDAGRVLVLDLLRFCEDVIAAAERWWAAHQTKEPMRTNGLDVAKIHEDGYAPYVIGLPVLR